jgi:hypothetical protein
LLEFKCKVRGACASFIALIASLNFILTSFNL